MDGRAQSELQISWPRNSFKNERSWFYIFSLVWLLPSSPTISPNNMLQQRNIAVIQYLFLLSLNIQFSSVTQSSLTLRNPMNRSTPAAGLPVHHQLLNSVYSNSCPSSWWCHPAISSSVVPFSSCPQSFQMSQLFTWGGQSIGVSASASVLPMNTQDWSPSGWTG